MLVSAESVRNLYVEAAGPVAASTPYVRGHSATCDSAFASHRPPSSVQLSVALLFAPRPAAARTCRSSARLSLPLHFVYGQIRISPVFKGSGLGCISFSLFFSSQLFKCECAPLRYPKVVATVKRGVSDRDGLTTTTSRPREGADLLCTSPTSVPCQPPTSLC